MQNTRLNKILPTSNEASKAWVSDQAAKFPKPTPEKLAKVRDIIQSAQS